MDKPDPVYAKELSIFGEINRRSSLLFGLLLELTGEINPVSTAGRPAPPLYQPTAAPYHIKVPRCGPAQQTATTHVRKTMLYCSGSSIYHVPIIYNLKHNEPNSYPLTGNLITATTYFYKISITSDTVSCSQDYCFVFHIFQGKLGYYWNSFRIGPNY